MELVEGVSLLDHLQGLEGKGRRMAEAEIWQVGQKGGAEGGAGGGGGLRARAQRSRGELGRVEDGVEWA